MKEERYFFAQIEFFEFKMHTWFVRWRNMSLVCFFSQPICMENRIDFVNIEQSL